MPIVPDNPDPTPVNLTEAEAALTRSFGGRWTIRFNTLRVWEAERRVGATEQRYVVGPSAEQLVDKLEKIEQAEFLADTPATGDDDRS